MAALLIIAKNGKQPKFPLIDEWVNEPWYIQSNIISQFKKWGIKSQKDMDESQMHIAKWKKPVWKSYILYDFNYIAFFRRQNYRDISVFAGGSLGKPINRWSIGNISRWWNYSLWHCNGEYKTLSIYWNPLNFAAQRVNLMNANLFKKLLGNQGPWRECRMCQKSKCIYYTCMKQTHWRGWVVQGDDLSNFRNERSLRLKAKKFYKQCILVDKGASYWGTINNAEMTINIYWNWTIT